jgi:hypothetical protein
MTDKPFHVIETFNPYEAADHWQHIAETSPLNRSDLIEKARELRDETPYERPVAHHATRGDADADAARRNAGWREPGISYHAEYLDVDEDWWTTY